MSTTWLVASGGHTSLQWGTLMWVAGAVVAAALIIAIIVVVSRRPKSMEDGMAEISRSLQALAPSYHAAHGSATGSSKPPRARASHQP